MSTRCAGSRTFRLGRRHEPADPPIEARATDRARCGPAPHDPAQHVPVAAHARGGARRAALVRRLPHAGARHACHGCRPRRRRPRQQRAQQPRLAMPFLSLDEDHARAQRQHDARLRCGWNAARPGASVEQKSPATDGDRPRSPCRVIANRTMNPDSHAPTASRRPLWLLRTPHKRRSSLRSTSPCRGRCALLAGFDAQSPRDRWNDADLGNAAILAITQMQVHELIGDVEQAPLVDKLTRRSCCCRGCCTFTPRRLSGAPPTRRSRCVSSSRHVRSSATTT